MRQGSTQVEWNLNIYLFLMQWLLPSVIQQISIDYLSLEVTLYTCIRDFWFNIAQFLTTLGVCSRFQLKYICQGLFFLEKNYKLWHIEEGKNNVDVF